MFKAEVIGNLGRDASVRQINGKDYVCFDLAHGERQNGEKRTVWISTLWPGNGGNLLQYLHKGTTVFVRGDFSAKPYTGKDGRTGISMSVIAREVQVCTFADKEQGQQQQERPGVQPAQQPVIAAAGEDEDLPF